MLNPFIRAITITEGSEDINELKDLGNVMIQKLYDHLDHQILVDNITILQNEITSVRIKRKVDKRIERVSNPEIASIKRAKRKENIKKKIKRKSHDPLNLLKRKKRKFESKNNSDVF